MSVKEITPERRVELLDWLDNVRYAAGAVYGFRMNVNYTELPIPSRTALRISRLEQDLLKLHADLKKAWTLPDKVPQESDVSG